MAIICTVENNKIWSYILNALDIKRPKAIAASQTGSHNSTILTTPLRTSELLDLCSSGEDKEIYVLFSPPSLVISSDNFTRLELEKVIIERTNVSEELLDLYYKFKHKLKLINSTFAFDNSNRDIGLNDNSFDLGSVTIPIGHRDLFSYLAFNNQIEKAHKIEKLLNDVSHVAGAEIDSLVSLASDRLELEAERVQAELAKSKEETTRLVEELTSKSNSFDAASEELSDIRNKYKILERERALEKDRLEFTVYSLQTSLEENIKRHKAEVLANTEKNRKSLEEAALVYEEKINVLEEKVAFLSAELSGRNDLCDSYKKKNIELEGENLKLEESLFVTQKTLENHVRKYEAKIQILSDEIQKLLTLNEQEVYKREQVESQSLKIKNDYDKRLKSVRTDKLELAKSAELQVSAKNKELVTLKVTSERAIDRLERENKSLQKELKSYQALYYQIKNDFDAVKESTTWKTLSPVLKVKDKVLGKSQKFDQDELISNIGLLYTSDLFDADWYLATYKDVAEKGLDPAKHYLLHGFKEGRRPSLNFDGNWYFNYYKDVKAAGFNPLVHFIKYGKAEGRKTSHNLLMNLDR